MAQDKFDVGGMTCAACQAHVDRAVSKLDGVQSVAVNLLAGSMMVDYDPAQVSPDDICTAVELAYGAVHMRLAGGARHAAHVKLILSHGFSFLWFGVGIVNLPILYTHTPWGCPVQKEMYDIPIQMRVAAGLVHHPHPSSQSVTSSRENDL